MANFEAQHPSRAHAIFLPFPTQGHIIPALTFAEKLASQGFTISFVCVENLIERIRKSHGAGLSPSIRLIALPDAAPVAEPGTDQGVDSLLSAIRMAENMAPAFEQTVSGLIEDAKESSVPPPMCIVSDFYVSWSQDTANTFKIPRYGFYPSPCLCLAVMLYLPRLIEQGIVPVASNAREAREIVVPGLPPMDASDMPQSWLQETLKERRDFSFRNLFRLHESSGIVVNTFYEAEGEAIDAVRTEAINPNKVPIYPLGPILPSKFFRGEPIDQEACAETDHECLQWLDAQAPSSVLFISFGSIAILSIRQIQEIAQALDACQQAFLWILRLPTSATDPTLFPEGFLSRTHNRGLIISTWAPQLRILSHPSTGGFMSHCGWNSTLESISSGVPILPLPLFAEQHMISRMVIHQLKVGVQLQRGADGVAESEKIEAAARELMQGEEGRATRRRARALKEEAARAVAEGGASHKALQAFIQEATATRTQS